MGLSGAFQVGHSALTASQLALQVTGNNIANLTTPGYSRQVISLRPAPGVDRGFSVGRGVLVHDVRRQVDAALQSRLWTSTSDEGAAMQRAASLGQIETILNELTGHDLSSGLSAFFNSWSEGANLAGSTGIIVQQGQQLASHVRELHARLVSQRDMIDGDLAASVTHANELLEQVATLNAAIADAEVGNSSANALRDQRDIALTELATLMNITVVGQSQGQVDVLVGSIPVVLAGASRGIELERVERDGELVVRLRVRQDGSVLPVTEGRLGALLDSRAEGSEAILRRLDEVASSLIFEVNRLHASGTNKDWLRTISGTLALPSEDRTRPLNATANSTLAGLPFAPSHGSFLVHVRQPGSGSVVSVRIDVDLDGRDAGGAASTADDTSAEDLRGAIDAIGGLRASFGPDGTLRVEADAGFEFAFGEDTSGVLAVLGVNTFFEGTSARDIGVRRALADDPSGVVTGRIVGGSFVENAVAMDIASVHERAMDSLGGVSMRQSWQLGVQGIGSKTATALTRAESSRLVRESLEAQRASISGVSADEEAVNMLNHQRAYQGAAKFLSVVDELTQILLALA